MNDTNIELCQSIAAWADDRERERKREQRIEMDSADGLLARKVVSRFTGELND